MMMIIKIMLATTTKKSQACLMTSRATMVPRKLKNNRSKKFHLSLTIFYSFVTQLIRIIILRIVKLNKVTIEKDFGIISISNDLNWNDCLLGLSSGCKIFSNFKHVK